MPIDYSYPVPRITMTRAAFTAALKVISARVHKWPCSVAAENSNNKERKIRTDIEKLIQERDAALAQRDIAHTTLDEALAEATRLREAYQEHEETWRRFPSFDEWPEGFESIGREEWPETVRRAFAEIERLRPLAKIGEAIQRLTEHCAQFHLCRIQGMWAIVANGKHIQKYADTIPAAVDAALADVRAEQ